MSNFLLFLKGLLMWACDVIPGISWGTIAFITGIYDELIDALHSFNLKTLKFLFTGNRKLFWKVIHWNFLVLVFWWIIISILSLVKLITFLLLAYPILVWAFFFWLILASTILIKKTIKKRTNIIAILMFTGMMVWFFVTTLPVVSLGDWYLSMFISWFFAIIAMILPGISGSYILVILWQYQDVLSKITELVSWNVEMIGFIGIFIGGCIVWLLSFSKLLHYLKKNRHDQLVAILMWFMLWSLNKVRPRKEVLPDSMDKHLLWANILPQSGQELIWGLSAIILWFWIVLLVDKISHKIKI